MKSLFREDRDGMASWLLMVIVAVVVIVSITAVLTLSGFFTPKALSTVVVVTDQNGKTYMIYQDNGAPSPPSGSIATVNGVQIAQIAWYTNFKASSQGYTQYTATAATDSTGMFYGSQPTDSALLAGSSVQCPNYATAVRTPGQWGTLLIGTSYDYGTLNRGYGSGAQAVQTATSYTITSYWGQGPCAAVGIYWVRYSIMITIQAAGVGQLPSSTYTEKVYTQVTVSVGTITITGASSAVASP
jgi:hypothetical protein